jgi:ribonuclease P protein component
VRGERFPPYLRVRKRSEYRRVQAGGRRVHGHRFIWIVMLREDRGSSAEKGAGTAGDTRGGAGHPGRRPVRAREPLRADVPSGHERVRVHVGEHRVAPARLGVVVTKKVAGGAVQRSRVKRLLREVFRRHRALLPAGVDVVAVAKDAAVAASYADVVAELASVAPRLARLVGTGPRTPPGGSR